MKKRCKKWLHRLERWLAIGIFYQETLGMKPEQAYDKEWNGCASCFNAKPKREVKR